MKQLRLSFIICVLLCVGATAESTGRGASPRDTNEQMLSERRHFLACLASVYSPAFWISYNDCLYFQPKNEAQLRQLESMKAARSRYVALTNREARHEIAAKGITASGIDERWRAKVLLPLSATNQDLTPTLRKPFRHLPQYKVLQTLPNGDALIQDDEVTYFVMDFGRGMDDAKSSNACLIEEGVKTYAEAGVFRTVKAFENVSLTKEEQAVLSQVAVAFQKQATSLAEEAADPKEARQEFDSFKARATDSNPYMQYLLAKCYLEGRGTEKNETLAMEWMKKAAKSGSGDASAYLEKVGIQGP